MANELMVLGTFNGVEIHARPGDQYIDVTAMCQANGKEWSAYSRLTSAKRFQDGLSKSLHNLQGPLVIQIGDGPNECRGTFVHRRIALHCAAWISPEFEQWVYERIEELLTTGRAEIQPQPANPLHAIRLMLDSMEAQERRTATLETTVGTLVASRELATQELRHVERAESPAPALTVRDRVNQLVRAYCNAREAEHAEVWRRLYRELFYRCNFNAQIRARNSGRKALDEVEEAGFMPDLFAIASELLVF